MAVDRRMSACRRKWSEDIIVAVIGKTGQSGPACEEGFRAAWRCRAFRT